MICELNSAVTFMPKTLDVLIVSGDCGRRLGSMARRVDCNAGRTVDLASAHQESNELTACC